MQKFWLVNSPDYYGRYASGFIVIWCCGLWNAVVYERRVSKQKMVKVLLHRFAYKRIKAIGCTGLPRTLHSQVIIHNSDALRSSVNIASISTGINVCTTLNEFIQICMRICRSLPTRFSITNAPHVFRSSDWPSLMSEIT